MILMRMCLGRSVEPFIHFSFGKKHEAGGVSAEQGYESVF